MFKHPQGMECVMLKLPWPATGCGVKSRYKPKICLFWHHEWACPPRCVLDRSVHQPTQWTVANVAHLSVTHPTRPPVMSEAACNGWSHSHQWYNMSPLSVKGLWLGGRPKTISIVCDYVHFLWHRCVRCSENFMTRKTKVSKKPPKQIISDPTWTNLTNKPPHELTY